MPPKSVRKTASGSGSKRGGRTPRGTPKSQAKSVKVEEPMEVQDKDKAVEEVSEEKPELKITQSEPEEPAETALNVNAVGKGAVSEKKKDNLKESVDHYEKGERLDLGDNDPEYEPEEYGTVDYDENGIEHDGVQEEGNEIEEEPEEADVGEEEEGDMAEEDVEDVHEENEGDEEDEHAEMADAAEEEEHHEVVDERRKRKEFEIFVGGLDKDATEEDLRKVFSKVGEITEVRLLMNSQTKKNKGFAFLRFATVEQAKRACTELKTPVINGKQCGVSPSQDNDTLFLGNICKTWTKEALKEKLKHYGVHNIEDLTLVEDTNNEGMNRGFAFLEFSSRSEAMDAFKRLQKRDIVFGVDRPAKVSFEDSFIDPGDEIMSQVKTVFIDGLAVSWNEDHVRELLKEYGKIRKVELARNRPSAKRKDFGFVTFDTHEAAVTCAKSINNEEFGEGDNKVKVRARLSRPLHMGRGKYGGRGEFRPWRMPMHGSHAPWGRTVPYSRSIRGTRVSTRMPPVVSRGFKRPTALRDRHAEMALSPRGRSMASPPRRSYDRRPPVSSYPKSNFKRDYGRREEISPSRSRAIPEYPSRVHSDRRISYRDEYSSRGSGYPELPRGTHSAARRSYVDDGYGQRFERPPPSYREGRGREYDSVSGSKRPYMAVDDVHPHYAMAGVRHSRARLDYELGSASGSHYGDAYGDRLGRSNLGYGGNRSSISRQDSHGIYSSRQGMDYGGGSYGGSDVGGLYSSSYGGDYMSRGSDVGSSVYSSRGMGGSGYMGSGGSGSYY
ncbi:heterogeneous nuclear ribonucleoprotein Q-like isoform X2 [Solanum lycopersicum]|uniref:heterogeneous nuclear ribonucleoprotein Q-like isoform X2 n=1 Tax=Solanum lycopersicum TaxID=4081 RepID=UPI000532F7BB|nr:heterogeneous nuclear ribonucleoprotein Q-like isoform X2 [Solanum lycopersicum]